MKLYIPEIGDKIVLTEDWTFTLYNEYRNEKLVNKLGWNTSMIYGSSKLEKKEITFLKDTSLKIDRIYIRKGASDYSSITFFIGSGDWKGCRFWAKLSDVNKIEFDQEEVEKSIKIVMPNSFFNYSQVDLIKDEIEFNLWSKYQNKMEYCKVDGKKVVEIRVNMETRNLTAEECKILNSQKLLGRKYRETDIKITKYDLEAYSLLMGEAGTLIGKSQTSSGISKKIKNYFKNKKLS
jgi:hypothetical protein